jgi:hypothetical protein
MPRYTVKPAYPSPSCAPGMEATQGPNARPPPYVPVNFNSGRVYENDNDGWTYVTYKKKGHKSRKWRDLRED